MRLKRVFARAISEICSAGLALRGPRHGLRVLLYHSIGSRLANDFYGISIRPSLFERHIQFLLKFEGAKVAALSEELITDSSALRIAVTFDDGYKDNLYQAAPILVKFQIPFTVFVSTSFIGNGPSEYLTSNELKELAALPGAHIGSHGVSHMPLALCDNATLSRELHDSRSRIEDVIGKAVNAIAYPHGSVDRRVRDAAERAGYSLGFCSRFDINDASRDRLLLCRSEIVAADSERVLRQKLSGAWDWLRWRHRDPVKHN